MSAPSTLDPAGGFTPEQKQYLEGFLAACAARIPFVGQTASGRITAEPGEAPVNLAAPPEDTVFGTPLGDLSKPERWKYEENPLDIWEKLVAHAETESFPNEADTFRFKYHGLFYVAPAQDSFMLRLRVPACEITATQFRGLADLANDLGGGYAHVTTRGNLQIREFKPRSIVKTLTRVQELGLTSRGAGADNIRNITASPDSGFAPDELLDARPYAKALHHYILNHRDLYGLPRKFNVAFDNGGSLSVAADTNDIGFIACRVTEASLALLPAGSAGSPPPPGIYFRVQLGGITGHGDFARDTGILVRPTEAVAVAVAMIRVFHEHGDRTNRKKARLKYLLESWGVEKFLQETEKRLSFPLGRLPLAGGEPRRPVEKQGWLGARRQVQRGFNSIGIGLPAGRMNAKQMRGLADVAVNYGKGELRLTVWQTVIIPHIPDPFVETVKRVVARMGFYTEASPAAGGIIACTGSRGCKYAATDTKAHAAALFKRLQGRAWSGAAPVNIHFTGCPHSCAQHYCGDIGFVGAKLATGDGGYHVMLGGGMDHEQGIGRELYRGVHLTEVNGIIDRIFAAYEGGKAPGESLVQWSRRHSLKELQEMLTP
jgi:ferredoxin-nitrite reductase